MLGGDITMVDADRMLGASYACYLLVAIYVLGVCGQQPSAHVRALLGGEITIVVV